MAEMKHTAIDCGCTAIVSYFASGNNIRVNLDGIDHCPRHSDNNARLIAALEKFIAAAERGAIHFSEQKDGCLSQARAALAKVKK